MYKAIFFSLDWDYQTEWEFQTIEEAQDYINDIGSRWIFYPLAFVATDKYIITSKGRRKISRVCNTIKSISENNILDDDSIVWIYDAIENL